MKNQNFGIEIEMTGITRKQAAEVAKAHFGEGATLRHVGGSYGEYRVTTADGRGWKFVYDGSIKCHKKVGNTMTHIADKEYSVELVSPILKYGDIETLQELVRKLRKAGAVSGVEYSNGIHVHVDGANHTPKTLKNIVNLMASKEDLLYKSLQVDDSRLRYCKKTNQELVDTINQKKPKTMAALADIWYENFRHEDRSRHYHESRYAGLNLHSIFRIGTVEFRLFNGTLHAGKIRAYIILALAISHQAIIQKSASPRKTITDNEKYTFRCWLLRLGFIGDEFKNCREHLMEHLDGNSAWRNAV